MSWDHKQSVKEVIRHFGLKVGADDLLHGLRKRRGLVTSHLHAGARADRFRDAYRAGAWVGQKGQQSRSGVGSDVAAASEVATALPELLKELGCRRLLDVGCGDWNWMRHVELPCEYFGIDVVDEVIQANRPFERPGVTFAVADAVTGPLPEADVVLCREVLFHLSFRDGLAVLRNIRARASWLIATTDTSIWFNSDIPTGDYRRLNLQRRPYRLRMPHRMISDDVVIPGRALGLWPSAELPSRLAFAPDDDRV